MATRAGEGGGPDTSGYIDYLLTNRDFTATAVTAAIQVLGVDGPARVLDAGTGAGGALGPLARIAGELPVTAVDIDPRAIELASAYAADLGLPVELFVDDALRVAQRAGQDGRGFDLIWGSDFVWPATFTDPEAVVAQLASGLTAGGTLALYTTNYYQSMFMPGHSRLERLVRTASEITWGLPDGGSTHYELLGSWLHQAGLVDVTLRVFPIAVSSVADHPVAKAYLGQIVWPEMLHAARSNGRAAGMTEDDVQRTEQLLDPEGLAWLGDDSDVFTMQPTLLWTGRQVAQPSEAHDE